jgi:type IV pilus assembly protein PilA
MFKAMKKKLKDQRGLTLIELLAVVVILGIIAAIAVPSVGKLIDNTKKEAHVANAQQMVNAARLAVNSGDVTFTSSALTQTITLSKLQTDGYLEGTLKNPNTENHGAYDTTDSLVSITKDGSKYTYSVTLVANNGTADKAYFALTEISTLDKTDVQ